MKSTGAQPLCVGFHWGREASEVWSSCRRYRYRLVHVWDTHRPQLGWVTLKAGQHRSDAEVRRCVKFARKLGYGGVDIGNLYGLASAGAAGIYAHPDPVGPNTDAHLAALCGEHDLVVLAWGDHGEPARAHAVAEMLWQLADHRGGSLGVLGWTNEGQPQNPLLVPMSATLECLTLGAQWRGLHETEDRRWQQLLAGAA